MSISEGERHTIEEAWREISLAVHKLDNLSGQTPSDHLNRVLRTIVDRLRSNCLALKGLPARIIKEEEEASDESLYERRLGNLVKPPESS